MQKCCIYFEEITIDNKLWDIKDICKECIKIENTLDVDETGERNLHPVQRIPVLRCICGEIWNRECFKEYAFGGTRPLPLFYELCRDPNLSGDEKRALTRDPTLFKEKEHKPAKRTK